MHRQFRTYTKKENRKDKDPIFKRIIRSKHNTQNASQYEKLSYVDIQNITRSMLHDSKAHQNNMGVISSIKGKMYCLKLGEVSSSKQFSHYFYCNQFKIRKTKAEPLKRLQSNSMYNGKQYIF